jgi:hypothetical protein
MKLKRPAKQPARAQTQHTMDGHALAVDLNIRISTRLHAHGIKRYCGCLPLVSLHTDHVDVRIRPWAIPQQPAGELLSRMVVGSVCIASYSYISLTQERCDRIYADVFSKLDAFVSATEAVTDCFVSATPTEYAFVRRLLSVFVGTGIVSVVADDLGNPEASDAQYRSRTSAFIAVTRDRIAKALGISG